MFDRRREVHEALLAMRDFRWESQQEVYDVVVRFNRSYEILREQVVGRVGASQGSGVEELYRRVGEVGRGRVPWAFHDAPRPAFWGEIAALANTAAEEVDQFPTPEFHVGTQRLDMRVRHVGPRLPDGVRGAWRPTEFAAWWSLRCRVCRLMREFGFTGPEDRAPVEKYSFYVSDDCYNDEPYLPIEVCQTFSVTPAVIGALAETMSDYRGWGAVLWCSKECGLCVCEQEVLLVGASLTDCATSSDALRTARVESSVR